MIKKIRNKLKSKKFTRWYIDKGYIFELHFWKPMTLKSFENFYIYSGEPMKLYACPWWVRPLLIFFDEDAYNNIAYGTHCDPVGEPGPKGLEDRFEEVKSFEDFFNIFGTIVEED